MDPDDPDDPKFDPRNKKDQRDKDWHYHWDKKPHEKRGGKPHWDRGSLQPGRDGKKQKQWSPDGKNWFPK